MITDGGCVAISWCDCEGQVSRRWAERAPICAHHTHRQTALTLTAVGCLWAAEKAPLQGARGDVAAEYGSRHRVDGWQRVNRPLRALRVGAAASQGPCAAQPPQPASWSVLTVCPRCLPARETSTWSRSMPWKRSSSCSGPSWKASSVTWCRFKRRWLVLGGKGPPLPKPYRTMYG